MNETDGPAFPCDRIGPDSKGGVVSSFGMTLRDYFAAKAMQGLIERGFTEFGNRESAYANLAYTYADAMLKARNADKN